MQVTLEDITLKYRDISCYGLVRNVMRFLKLCLTRSGTQGIPAALFCGTLISYGFGIPSRPLAGAQMPRHALAVGYTTPRASTQSENSPANRVRVLGDYETIDHSVPGDASGYVLRLWKQGNQIYGLFSVYVGPVADPPTGLLEEVRFYPATGGISFKALLSGGPIYGRGFQGVPAREIFRFSGQLSRSKVTGVMVMSNGLFPNDKPVRKRITLRRSADMTKLMNDANNLSEWEKDANAVLKRPAPKS